MVREIKYNCVTVKAIRITSTYRSAFALIGAQGAVYCGFNSHYFDLDEVNMSSKQYITMEAEEKDVIQEAKAADPRFCGDSRIADGSYIALALREYMEQFEEDTN